ncbi:MAG: TolC family protein [Candidatus Binataceae bacterium]
MAPYKDFRRSISQLMLTLVAAAFVVTTFLDAPVVDAAGETPVPVDALVTEAMRSNPEIAAARSHWQGSTKVPRQVSTLDDPEVSLQEFTVGSPAPASGYETSDFYYTGFGVSQDIPGPGKLRLRARRAEKDAEYAGAVFESAERRVAEKVRETGFNLFFLDRVRTLLESTRRDLQVIARGAEQQYRTGMGQQQDVLKAQLAATSILKDSEMNRDDIEAAEASLKALLGREPDTGDIAIADVTPTPFKLEGTQLGEAAEAGSADVEMARAMAAGSKDALDIAQHDYWPDFTVGYQYNKTGPAFRDYYMLTLGAKIPLYFWRKQTPAVEQAAAEKASAESQLHATRLETLSDLRSNAVAIRTQDRIITLYRDGLIPQGEATFRSAEAAYRTGKVDFQTLLSSVIDLLNLREGYYRAIADHEIAVARVKQIIGEQS